MARFAINPLRRDEPDWSTPELAYLQAIRDRRQLPLHRALPGYAPSPLRELPDLARELGLGGLVVKDESHRCDIDAFKALGASYAIYSVLCDRWREDHGEDLPVTIFDDPELRARLHPTTFTAATDGNHGRAVAWAAHLLGQSAVIYMPADTAAARIASIEREGAEVRLIEGTFDHCVTMCARTAETESWQVIADTAYPGNMVIPGHIMTGYSTIFAEIADQLTGPVDVVLLPAGVGGLAAAGTASFVQRLGARRPRLVCVEPEESACFLESILHGDGTPIAARGNQQSLMVGLCCGVPSLLAWPVVRDGMDLFLAISDDHVPQAMRAYHRHGVTSGESGASTLAGLLALLQRDDLAAARRHLDLGPQSRVLVINTEGATDPVNHARVIAAADDRSPL